MAKTKKKKTTTKKKKTTRKATSEQLKALKKARAARKRNMNKTTRKKIPKTSTKVARKKPTKSVKRSTRKKRGGTYMAKRTSAIGRGAKKFLKKSNAAELMTNAGLAVAGGVASGFLASKIPTENKKLKATVPIVTGILMAGLLGKNKIVMSVSQGMVILGTVSLFKQYAPTVPFLAGDGRIRLPYNPVTRRNNMLGRKVQLAPSAKMGRIVKFSGGGDRRISHEKRRYRIS